MVKTIDINADVGEGVGNEAELFKYISSCNIACGGHAGDATSMRAVAKLAHKYEIKIGAHPSYPDVANFGRVVMDISRAKLQNSLREQLHQFISILEEENIPLHHIKPHGALYNVIAKDKELAVCFLEGIKSFLKNTKLFVPYNSQIAKEAQKRGVQVVYEAFIDRRYNADLSLVSRKKNNAVIKDPNIAFQQLLQMVQQQSLIDINGSEQTILADTYCIHGDSPTAIEILMYLSATLPKHQVQIKQ